MFVHHCILVAHRWGNLSVVVEMMLMVWFNFHWVVVKLNIR